ncbi:MAG TPA: cyclodeaminase/cyclohydrolase family protein [Steroidobacteraceae bacterium]|nr:cyclodeaminase/cyclohydrolase family protein [Steroidobacteraceae bacterium]
MDGKYAMLAGMIADGDLSRVTLEQFRREAAGQHPMPAGVAIAAVSAGFALALVAKVLAVSGRHNALPENTARLEPLAAAAQTASQRMLQLAADDVVAFEAYLAARRLPRATEAERQARQQAIDSAARRAIDLPLAAAQEAATGLQLCIEVSAFTPVGLAADLGVTAGLLAGALRGFLLCAQSNVGQLAPEAPALRERVAIETERYAQALRMAETLAERARATGATAATPGKEP